MRLDVPWRCAALAGCLAVLTGCAAGVGSVGLVVAQPASSTTLPGFVPLPAEFLAGAPTARRFVQRAMDGEDASDMVADALPQDIGSPRPVPELPTQLAARAARELAFEGTAQDAAQVVEPGNPPRAPRDGFPGMPNCTSAGDLHMACTVVVRTAFGSGLVTVLMQLPDRSGRLAVDDFFVIQRPPSITG